MGNAARQWELAGQAGVKRLLYYDLGEVGDYAGFFGADGKMRHNGWSIPFWKSDEPLTARWFGLQAFMQNASWSPWPTAKDYGLPPFTAPGGSAADDLYRVLSRRDLDGKWAFDHFSNARVTDEIAERSGLAGISQRQQGKADVQGKSGWVTSRLIHVDFGNPQLLDYQCREIARLIPKLRPDGIHADNFGDLHIARADVAGFGLWSVHGFREFLKRHFSQAELAGMGIADVDTFDPPQARLRGGFDIAAYVREKQMEPKGNKWMQLRSPKWTADPIWLRYLVYKVETGLGYHRRFYEAAKQAAAQAGVDCAVFGNLVPGAPGAALMKGFCDIAHFEWSATRGWWGLREMALPPKGRVGYVARLGAAISDAGYCWPSLYVPKNLSGAGHENLHKVLAFDCLANRGLLDFGHWFLDGYSPGTPESAGFINRFIRSQAARLSRREYLADVAVVHSAWSEVASLTVFHPVTEMFIDEYSGWCQFLGDTHRQWDVVLAEDLSAARLARFPIVVLPSVMVLTDAQAAELSKYVEAGGRLVATGLTGTRYGPDKYLALRPANALGGLAARIVPEKPGVAYWRQDRDSQAAKRMAELLDWPGFRPRLETDAPMTVGVNLSVGKDADGPLMTLDLNNCDLDVEADMIRPAPPCTVAIRLPESWRGKTLDVSYVTPETRDGEAPRRLPEESVTMEREKDILTIKTPASESFLAVFIRL